MKRNIFRLNTRIQSTLTARNNSQLSSRQTAEGVSVAQGGGYHEKITLQESNTNANRNKRKRGIPSVRGNEIPYPPSLLGPYWGGCRLRTSDAMEGKLLRNTLYLISPVETEVYRVDVCY